MSHFHRRVPKCSKRRLIIISLFYWILSPMLFLIWTNIYKHSILLSTRTRSGHSSFDNSFLNQFWTQPSGRHFNNAYRDSNENILNSVEMTEKYIINDVDYKSPDMINLMTESLITLNSEITLKVENSTATPGRHFVTEIPDLKIENLDIGKQYSVEELLPDGIKIHNADDDRIMLQLNHVPKDYQEAVRYERPVKKKTIYFYGGLKRWGMPDAKTYFKEHKCKIDKCDFIDDTKEGRNADAIVFSNPGKLPWKKPWPRSFQKQIWALLMLESPFHTRRISDDYKNMFNWTMTYRRDSTISTPYQKIQIDRNRKLKQNHTMPNMAAGKTKKVAWFVSNCVQVQSGRMKYAEELSKHIDVDIFGSCGKKRCSKRNMGSCFDILNKDYKFYLSFENSKCKHYVTEKLFENALRNNIVPVVLGASPVDYQLIAPPGSFIHVEDFSSPKALADYLHKLDSNDELYNQYFEWKSYGTFIDAAPWCRFCAMLHETELPNTWYSDINDWWGAKTTCIGRGNWPKNLE